MKARCPRCGVEGDVCPPDNRGSGVIHSAMYPFRLRDGHPYHRCPDHGPFDRPQRGDLV